MGHQGRHPAQVDLWDLTLRTVDSIESLDAATRRLASRVHAVDQSLSRDILGALQGIHGGFTFHEVEAQAIPPHDLPEAFRELTRRGGESVGNFRRVLARADQLLGRTEYLQQFEKRAPPR